MKAAPPMQEFAAMFWNDLTCAFSLNQWRNCLQKLSKVNRRVLFSNLVAIIPQIAVFYALLSPAVASPLYNKILFYPSKEHAFAVESLAGIAKENIFIASGGEKLNAWLFDKTGAKGTVLISHGNAGNISHRIPIIEYFLSQNFSVLAYDYQGYGLSTGEPGIDKICQDGLAAYDYLSKERKIPPEKIVLFGESLGGGVSAHIAGNREAAAIVLQSTFSSLPHVARSKMLLMRAYPNFLFPKNKMDSAKILAGAHPPLLIIHGTGDGIIPCKESKLIYEKAAEPKKLLLIEGGGHNDLFYEYKDETLKGLSEFLKNGF
ncbi:MAG: alpha/beta hydrolase [Candidatus Obscuribacter phosphatis]|uniref:Alpha/beta hydrolase n=1 Tax=Candidatus Obscuribacter phosphatis TaxID=1906157 RepID=A0A8J7TMH2_9BACT|nr:alpha/beta hydrolase [Candidatus Obscuribacter phosphatis]